MLKFVKKEGNLASVWTVVKIYYWKKSKYDLVLLGKINHLGGVMNKDIFQGAWEETKGKLKKQWGKLTDNDLKEIEGNHQEIFGKLQKHYGYTKDQIKKEIDSW